MTQESSRTSCALANDALMARQKTFDELRAEHIEEEKQTFRAAAKMFALMEAATAAMDDFNARTHATEAHSRRRSTSASSYAHPSTPVCSTLAEEDARML